VGDPLKDTSSVAMNPIIKFITLFGLPATEIAVTMPHSVLNTGIGILLLAVALVFVYRSFYAMRIPEELLAGDEMHNGTCESNFVVEPENLAALPRHAIPTIAPRDESMPEIETRK
jgi:hypothetical protein